MKKLKSSQEKKLLAKLVTDIITSDEEEFIKDNPQSVEKKSPKKAAKKAAKKK